jgi:hypothetical protein
MSLKILIKDGKGTGNLAGVSSAGELVVKGFGDNISNNQAMTVNGQAYNFFPPLPGQAFVITTIIFSVKANTILTIFSAPSATSTVQDTLLFSTTITIATTQAISFSFGGFLSVGEGEFLNATTSNATSQMTIVGFYRPT